MEEGKKFPTGGHIVVDKVDGKPHICIQWEYEEENPPEAGEKVLKMD